MSLRVLTKGIKSQKEVSTVNVMCFTACSSMAQRVDIIAFSEVEKQEGYEETRRSISAPCISDSTQQSILTYCTTCLQKTHVGKLEGLWRLVLLTALFVLLVQRIRDRVAIFKYLRAASLSTGH